MSAAVFFATGGSVRNLSVLLMLSLLNSCSFALATIAHIEALKRLPAGITFPLTRMSLLAVIIFSVLYLGERLAPLQWLGVLFGCAVVVILTREARSSSCTEPNLRTGLFFVAVCVFCGAIATISSKLAAEMVNKAGFMALSYLFGIFFSLGIEKRWGDSRHKDRVKSAIVIGVVMGLLNFFGFYAFLVALSSGPLSAIALMTGMHFVIAILLSVLIYREAMTLRRGLGLGLAILAVILLKQ